MSRAAGSTHSTSVLTRPPFPDEPDLIPSACHSISASLSGASGRLRPACIACDWTHRRARRRIARDPDRVLPLLRQRGVVDDEKAALVPDQTISLLQQGRLERGAVPDARRDEMVKPVLAYLTRPGRHRLHALAVPRADQTSNVEGAHPPTRRMRQPGQERLKPSFEIVPPAFPEAHNRRVPSIMARESATTPPGSNQPANSSASVMGRLVSSP